MELAASGREALARLRADDKFDVILCDLMMPDMTGMELFEELEKAGSAKLDRFVFMTGGAFTASARQFLDRVSNAVLEKPFSDEMLRTEVRACAWRSLSGLAEASTPGLRRVVDE